MAKPFKFRYVNEIVGTFVLLIVGLLIAGIVLAGRAQDWFKPVRRFRLEFPPAGSLGIQKDAEVKVLEYKVGKVDRLFMEGKTMMGDVTVKGDFISLVRADSKVEVKLTYNMAGAAFIDISQGQGEELKEGATLQCNRAPNVIDQVQNVIIELKGEILPLINSVNSTVTNVNELLVAPEKLDRLLQGVLTDIKTITDGLAKGQGPAGKLLRDPAMGKQIEEMLESVRLMLADVQKLVAEAKASVGHELNDLPGTVSQVQETIRESERLIEGIQRHWLMRGSMGPPESGEPIVPGEVLRP